MFIVMPQDNNIVSWETRPSPERFVQANGLESLAWGLSLDLALRSGWALGILLPSDVPVTIPSIPLLVKTRVVVTAWGVVQTPGDAKTLADEGKRLHLFAAAIDDLVKRYAPGYLFFESAVKSTWQRRLRRTGAAQATMAALRGCLLERLSQYPYVQAVEVKPENWQPQMIGRVRREIGKLNSIEAAKVRLGVIENDADVSDACLILEYGLMVVSLKLAAKGANA